MIDATEHWVKNKQKWPANIQRQKKEQQARIEKGSKEEHEWRRDSDKDKHHDAYATENERSTNGHTESNGVQNEVERKGSESQRLESLYTPQELALLRNLEHEKNHLSALKENDGKGPSPQHHNRTQISIDELDQFSPDNWIPRSSHLIRITGKHPLNAEPSLTDLYDSGLITANELH